MTTYKTAQGLLKCMVVIVLATAVVSNVEVQNKTTSTSPTINTESTAVEAIPEQTNDTTKPGRENSGVFFFLLRSFIII